jgi:hypothetical protein
MLAPLFAAAKLLNLFNLHKSVLFPFRGLHTERERLFTLWLSEPVFQLKRHFSSHGNSVLPPDDISLHP